MNAALVGIVAQRLVRKNCEFCKTVYTPTHDEVLIFQNIMKRAPLQLAKSKGCTQCKNLTFRGRTAIFEVLTITTVVRDLIRMKVSEDELRKNLIGQQGLVTLLQDGLIKCEQGLTTIEEVLRNKIRIH